MKSNHQPTAIFVADSHFHLRPDAAEKRRVASFLTLLELSRSADHIILLGDIFDFWFDYPHFRLKGYDTILGALDAVHASGTRIHFVGGNHDIWAAAYLHERYGSEPGGESRTLPLGDLRVHLVHGDGMLAHDWIYSSFRGIVRSRLGIVLAKSLHPELLYHFCAWLSGKSRSATRNEATEIEAMAQHWLAVHPAVDWDLLVMGHMHHPLLLEHERRRLAMLGGWVGHLGYAVLQDGRFELREFDRDPLPQL